MPPRGRLCFEEFVVKKLMALLLTSFILLTGCGGSNAVYETSLNGYLGNRLRLKYKDTLTEVTLENGQPGYLLTTDIRYSEGGNKRQGTLTKVWMNKDFTLVKRINEIFTNGEVTSKQVTSVDGKKITHVDNKTGKDIVEEFQWKHPQPLYGEVHPLLYSSKLEKSGDTEPFWIFFEPLRDGAPVRVKHRGKSTVTLKGQAYPCNRYSVRSLQKPGAYSDYYLTEEDNRVIKVVMGELEFVPPGMR